LQLDEVAYPLILAWRLWKEDGLGEMDIYPFVEKAAGFLVRHAPITYQERWEENAGYSPSTLAAAIAGLLTAAEIVRAHESVELATFLEEFADCDQRGSLAPGDPAALYAHPAARERRGVCVRKLRHRDDPAEQPATRYAY
jgi:hypothetical protein